MEASKSTKSPPVRSQSTAKRTGCKSYRSCKSLVCRTQTMETDQEKGEWGRKRSAPTSNKISLYQKIATWTKKRVHYECHGNKKSDTGTISHFRRSSTSIREGDRRQISSKDLDREPHDGRGVKESVEAHKQSAPLSNLGGNIKHTNQAEMGWGVCWF